jgi:hypothetical protein
MGGLAKEYLGGFLTLTGAEDRKDGDVSDEPLADPHLDWLNQEKAKKVFNLGSCSVGVSREHVIVRGKVGTEWGKEQIFDRNKVEPSVTVRSRSSQYILYIGIGFYILGFMTLFVIDGLRETDQLYLFGLSLFILLLPIVLYVLIPIKPFLVGSAAFYLVIFSLPQGEQLQIIFTVVEDMLGSGYVESFFIGAGMLPIVMHIIVSQTLVRYDFWLKEGDRTFHTQVSGRAAHAAANYIRNWSPPERRFSPERFMWSDFQMFFLRLSKARTKSCSYCGETTLVECNRCHTPICKDHFEIFRGYKVCLDCYVERKGNLGELRRRMNR